MVNDQGGINGRKIDFISRDDGYSPPKTVEQVRKLVEEDQVLAMFQHARHAAQSRHPRLPQRQQGAATVRRLPAPTSGTIRSTYPWTMGWQPSYGAEARILRPLHPEESAERENRRALSERRLRQGLSQRLARRPRRQGRQNDRRHPVAMKPPTRRSTRRSSRCKASGADVLLIAAIPKFAARHPQGLRYRLEADAFLNFGVHLGRHRDEACRDGERRRHHLGRPTPRTRPIRNGRTRRNTRIGSPG